MRNPLIWTLCGALGGALFAWLLQPAPNANFAWLQPGHPLAGLNAQLGPVGTWYAATIGVFAGTGLALGLAALLLGATLGWKPAETK